MEQKFEILTFKDGDFSLPVNVSPTEDTVWLTLEEMGKLFDRDPSVIGKHIKNIYAEKEQNEIISSAKNAVQINGQGRFYEQLRTKYYYL